MKVSENLSIVFMVEMPSISQKTGLAPIYVRITLNGQRSELSLGMRIKPEVWNKEHGRVIGKTEETMLMNNKITQVKAKLEKTYFLLTTLFEQVTADMIKKAYQGKPVHSPTDDEGDEIKERKTFIQAVDFEIDRLKDNKKGCGQKYYSKMEQYESQVNCIPLVPV